MYRNDDEFVRGQKIKLILIAILLFLAWAAHGFKGLAQVPATATNVTLTQQSTILGTAIYSATINGIPVYIEIPAYVTVSIPGGPTSVNTPIPISLWQDAPVTPPAPTYSPDGTIVKNATSLAAAAVITDVHGDKWSSVNGEVYINGDPDPGTSGVVELEIKVDTSTTPASDIIWQLNSAGDWYYWNDAAQTWDGGAGPS